MKDDTISRAAAIDAICEDGTQRERQGQYSITMVERKYLDTEILEALPSAQPDVPDTNVGDMISRQAAIAEIMGDLEDRSLHDDPATPEDYAEGYDEGIRNAAAIVLQMPSSQPEWIPVTERLPDESGEYLVIIRYKDGGNDVTGLIKYISCWREWNDVELFGGEVIAWQPKPKPWKGDVNG